MNKREVMNLISELRLRIEDLEYKVSQLEGKK